MDGTHPSSIRKHCGCCGTLPSVCPSCRPAVRSTDSRSNNRQGRNTPPPPCRRLIVASSAPPPVSPSIPLLLFRLDQRPTNRPLSVQTPPLSYFPAQKFAPFALRSIVLLFGTVSLFESLDQVRERPGIPVTVLRSRRRIYSTFVHRGSSLLTCRR